MLDFNFIIFVLSGELDEQLKDYINEWRQQRAKEEEELKRMKEKQVTLDNNNGKSTFKALYLCQFSAAVQKRHFCGAKICIIFGANIASQFKRFMLELHLKKVLFGTNL